MGVAIIASIILALIFLGAIGPFFLSSYSVFPTSASEAQMQIEIRYTIVNPSPLYLSPYSISMWISSPSGANISSESTVIIQIPPLKETSGVTYANLTFLPSASGVIMNLYAQNKEPEIFVMISSNIFGLATVTSIYKMNSTS